jgi:Rad51
MVRTEYDASSSADMALRTALLFRVAKELKWISDIFKVCIVVINQVCKSTLDGAVAFNAVLKMQVAVTI